MPSIEIPVNCFDHTQCAVCKWDKKARNHATVCNAPIGDLTQLPDTTFNHVPWHRLSLVFHMVYCQTSWFGTSSPLSIICPNPVSALSPPSQFDLYPPLWRCLPPVVGQQYGLHPTPLTYPAHLQDTSSKYLNGYTQLCYEYRPCGLAGG